MYQRFSVTLFTLGLVLFLVGYLSVGFGYSWDIICSNVSRTQNTMLFGENRTALRISNTTSFSKRIAKRLILFLEDGAKPSFLFGNTTYKDWKPFFQSYLETDSEHTVCTPMKVSPPTSTTQGVKTVLTGGMPSFIELGQTFYSDHLVSDHFLKQAYQAGLR